MRRIGRGVEVLRRHRLMWASQQPVIRVLNDDEDAALLYQLFIPVSPDRACELTEEVFTLMAERDVGTPGVAFGFEVAEETGKLRGEAALLHHQIASHVRYFGDVLDKDGARLHARPASGTRPERFVHDPPAHEGERVRLMGRILLGAT